MGICSTGLAGRRFLPTAAAVVAGFLAAAPPALASLTWSTPVLVDHQPPYAGDYLGGSLGAISCASSRLCVAGGSGALLSSTDPTGGIRAWDPVQAPSTDQLTGVAETAVSGLSCPSSTLCVGTVGLGVVTSTGPARAAAAWKLTVFPQLSGGSGGSALTAVSCASPQLCVAVGAVGGVGEVFSSTDPTGGPRAWKEAQLSGLDDTSLVSVSCPSST